MSVKPYYVNNKELYQHYADWFAAKEQAALADKPEPEIPAPIVDAIIKIATRLSYSPKFINYSFREDMISDAILDCIRYVNKFKLTYVSKKDGLTKMGDSFNYLTTISINAFYRRIDAEKTQSYVKAKIIAETPIHEFYDSIDPDDVELQQNFNEFMAENSENMSNNEPMVLKRKRKKAAEKAALEEGVPDVEDGLSIIEALCEGEDE